MMKGVIRLGDALTQGGCVTSASGAEFEGKSVMLLGDSAHCAAHGKTTAAEGHTSWMMNGRNVVVDSCRAQCGCAFISSLPDAGAS
ncbi:PAAR domain-containing protein [Erwinia typographi]